MNSVYVVGGTIRPCIERFLEAMQCVNYCLYIAVGASSIILALQSAVGKISARICASSCKIQTLLLCIGLHSCGTHTTYSAFIDTNRHTYSKCSLSILVCGFIFDCTSVIFKNRVVNAQRDKA